MMPSAGCALIVPAPVCLGQRPQEVVDCLSLVSKTVRRVRRPADIGARPGVGDLAEGPSAAAASAAKAMGPRRPSPVLDDDLRHALLVPPDEHLPRACSKLSGDAPCGQVQRRGHETGDMRAVVIAPRPRWPGVLRTHRRPPPALRTPTSTMRPCFHHHDGRHRGWSTGGGRSPARSAVLGATASSAS